MTDQATQLTDDEIAALASAKRKERLRGDLERLDRKIDALTHQLEEAIEARARLLDPAPDLEPEPEPVVLTPDDTDGDTGGDEE